MIEACKQFLTEQLEEVMGEKKLFPFQEENIFFEPMPRDFLKTHPFAVCCLIHSDKKKKDSRLLSNIRSADCTYYTRTWKRYQRQIIFRVLIYAADFSEQWGKPAISNVWTFDAYKGLVDKIEAVMAGTTVIADELNNAVKVELMDSFRPWDQEIAKQILKRRPHRAIVRVVFTGGIYVQKEVPIIGDVDIQPEFK